MPTKVPRIRRKAGAPDRTAVKAAEIILPAPTPLAPELAAVDEPVDDPPTNPGARGPASFAGDTAGSNGDPIVPHVPLPGRPTLSLSGSARKPLPRAVPLDDDDLDEVAPDLGLFHQACVEPPRSVPTPVEVTLDSVDDPPPITPVPDPEPAPSPVASQLDDMLGPAPAELKELKMSPTTPVPPPSAPNKPDAWHYAAAGIVAVLGVIVAVGNIPPTLEMSDLWPIASETVDANDVATTAPPRPDEIPTPAVEDTAKEPLPDPAELWANRPHPESFPLPAGTELVENPPVPTKVAVAEPPPAAKPVVAPPPPAKPIVAAVEAPKPVVATVAKPTAPPPAPKAILPESLTVSATGLKPACKAACSWSNVDPKDGFPYTVAGRRDVVCGDVTYSVAKWEKIAEGKERFCFTATGLSDQ